jgi:membrane-bound lytic murein transglycosylase D
LWPRLIARVARAEFGLLMRGNLVTSLAMVCLSGIALTGCVSTSATDLATNPGDQFALVGSATVGAHPQVAMSSRSATTSLSANSSDTAEMDAAVSLAEGVPYVRSGPHKVPPFPLVLNQSVQRYVDDFIEHNAGLRESFRRSRPYLPTMVKVMESHDLPPELVYLSFAESSFSSKGAGPWQLSVETARRFDLRVNRYIDERRDPIKSTRAAAQYLSTLHDQAGDWRVALVGWNRGDTAMNDYFSLRGVDYNLLTSHLPYNTRALLDRFMAVALEPVKYTEPDKFRVIQVKGGTRLAAVARQTGVSVQVLRDYNPAILHDRVPPGPSYELRLPLQESADARDVGMALIF